MSSITLKTSLNSDIRRFTFSPDSSFQDLQQLLSKLYGKLEEGYFYKVKYQDDEGDYISITNDLELAEAFHFNTKLPLRFYLSVDEKTASIPVELFKSWVMLFSEAKNQLTQAKENKKILQEPEIKEEFNEVIDEFHVIEEKIALTSNAILDDTDAECKVSEKRISLGLPVRELVQILSKEIAASMVELSSRIVDLIKVDENSENVEHVKNVLLQAEILACESLKICNSLSDEALQQVKSDSASILEKVSSDSQFIISLLENFYKSDEQPNILRSLSEQVLDSCGTLSSSTKDQCISDSDSIAQLIRDL